jgi:hypothetical protein
MANKIYEDIRQAFQSDPRGWANAIGLTVKGQGSGKALNCICPRCETHKRAKDAKAALAIFTDSGNVNCKGCGWKTTDNGWRPCDAEGRPGPG